MAGRRVCVRRSGRKRRRHGTAGPCSQRTLSHDHAHIFEYPERNEFLRLGVSEPRHLRENGRERGTHEARLLRALGELLQRLCVLDRLFRIRLSPRVDVCARERTTRLAITSAALHARGEGPKAPAVPAAAAGTGTDLVRVLLGSWSWRTRTLLRKISSMDVSRLICRLEHCSVCMNAHFPTSPARGSHALDRSAHEDTVRTDTTRRAERAPAPRHGPDYAVGPSPPAAAAAAAACFWTGRKSLNSGGSSSSEYNRSEK